MNFGTKELNVLPLRIFEFRSTRHRKGCTFLIDLNENHVYRCKVSAHCTFNVNSSPVKCVVRVAVHNLQYCCNCGVTVAKQITNTSPEKKNTSRPYSTLFVETPGKLTITMALPVVSTFTTAEGVPNTGL